MTPEPPIHGDYRDREEAAVWLIVTVLWRFGTGRPLFAVDGWFLSRQQRAACRWTLVALVLGLTIAPGLTLAVATAAGCGFAAGAMWARCVYRRHPAVANPPRTRRSQDRSTYRPRLTGDAAVLPLWPSTRKDT